MAKDPYRYFRIEARELLEGLSEGVLQLEQEGVDNSIIVRKLFRLAHTLKGASRVVKLVQVAEQAHAIEDLLTPYRDSGDPVSADAVEAMLQRLDGIKEELASLHGPEETSSSQDKASASSRGQFDSVRIALAELDRLLQATLHAGVTLERMREMGRGRRRPAADNSRRKFPSVGLATPAPQWGEPGLEQMAQEEALAKDLRKLREQVFELRLLPAATVFADLKRGVRDAAKSHRREVKLETRGGELRVDAHVLSTVRGGLLHLVRNAVAHGIEDAGIRKAAGKAAEGLVSVVVERRGHSVAFICRDDGRGIDVRSIGRAAAKRGLIGAEAARSLDTSAAIDLLLAGGLSTTETVTEISGRGVGLDAAREVVDRLEGDIAIHSSDGAGTTVEMIVPLSLSSMPALAVEAAGAVLLIPLDVVAETLRIDDNDVAVAAEGELALWKEEQVSLVPLARVVGFDETSRGKNRCRSAVVLRAAQGHVAVTVDRVLDVRNVVVHPLPQLSDADDIVAGAAFDPMGQPQLVLSPSGLLDALAGSQSLPTGSRIALPEPQAILVIDDSLTTRMLEQSILQSAGYEVDLAVSAEEALQKAKQRRYGLFIVDVEMPGINGFEFIAAVDKDNELRDIPSILVTSRGEPEDRRRGAEVGAAAYFVKSEFDQVALLDTIKRLIG